MKTKKEIKNCKKSKCSNCNKIAMYYLLDSKEFYCGKCRTHSTWPSDYWPKYCIEIKNNF